LNEEEEKKKKEEEEMKLFGRYWILEDLVEPSKRQVFEECVEELRHINKAVQ